MILCRHRICKLTEVSLIKKYRNEWKYCCSANELDIIAQRLPAMLERDSNADVEGKYEIHSLYFDDYKDICAKENEAGISDRLKYRIRYYGDQSDYLKLECKQKKDSRCYKESCQISQLEYQKITEGDVEELFWQTEKPLLKRFCAQSMSRRFLPKAIVNYERIAYVEEILNIRVTLDLNISVSDEYAQFLDGTYMRYPVLEKGKQVLEVKFDYILPGYIRNIIMSRNLIQSAFSKYYLGRKKLQGTGMLKWM